MKDWRAKLRKAADAFEAACVAAESATGSRIIAHRDPIHPTLEVYAHKTSDARDLDVEAITDER